jgi:hypothetical protein
VSTTPEALATWALRQYGAHAPDYISSRLEAAQLAGDEQSEKAWKSAQRLCRSDPDSCGDRD